MLDSANPVDPLEVLKQEKSWRRAIHRDEVRVKEKLSEFKLAHAKHDLEKVDKVRHWLLTSPSAKRASVAQLLRSGKDLNVWSYDDVKSLASSVTVFEPMDEPVRLFVKEKVSKTGYRTIFSFEDRHRVAQHMVARIIAAQTVPRGFQLFDAGVPKAITRILSMIEVGNFWIAHLDIKDFFPSFTMEGLTDFLPLPQTVVEAVLTGRNMVLKSCSLPLGCPYSSSHLIKEARRGLPQGASSSPAISHLCISQLAIDVATLEQLFNYEDDFLLLAKSEAELNWKITQLKDAVGSLPGGQFDLSVKSVAQTSKGLDFLGHRIFTKKGKALAEPSVWNTTRLVKRLLEIDEKYDAFSCSSGKVSTPALLQASADKLMAMDCWKGAFKSCDPLTEGWQLAEAIEEDIHCDLSCHGLTLSELPPASKFAAPKQRKFYYYKWFG